MKEMSVFQRSYPAFVSFRGSPRRVNSYDHISVAAILRVPAWVREMARYWRMPGLDDSYDDCIIIAKTRVDVLMRVLEADVRPVQLDGYYRRRITLFAVEIPLVQFFRCCLHPLSTFSGFHELGSEGDDQWFVEKALGWMGQRDLFSGPLRPWVRYIDEENQKGAHVPEAWLFDSAETALDYLYLDLDKLRGFDILQAPEEWLRGCFGSRAQGSFEHISA